VFVDDAKRCIMYQLPLTGKACESFLFGPPWCILLW
jgi:hypothetical protein